MRWVETIITLFLGAFLGAVLTLGFQIIYEWRKNRIKRNYLLKQLFLEVQTAKNEIENCISVAQPTIITNQLLSSDILDPTKDYELITALYKYLMSCKDLERSMLKRGNLLEVVWEQAKNVEKNIPLKIKKIG